METVYEWLYGAYAAPRLKHLPEFQDREAEALLALLPPKDHLLGADTLDLLQDNWCIAAFELGVRLGLRLNAPDGERGA